MSIETSGQEREVQKGVDVHQFAGGGEKSQKEGFSSRPNWGGKSSGRFARKEARPACSTITEKRRVPVQHQRDDERKKD